ncbi:MAG: helicase, partial [Candidatus Methanoperedens sp.]|nr:helicase [Candidatus Methanoperedens sp.]
MGRAGHWVGEKSSGTIITTGADDAAESSAITRRAKSGEIEIIDIHENSTDTLANQICGLVLDFGKISIDRIFSIVTRAYPFRTLKIELLRAVVKQIDDTRLIRFENDMAGKRMKSWQYYYEN